MAKKDTTLEQVIAAAREVEAGGRTVQVRPLSPRQLPPFIAAVRPLQDAIGAGMSLDALDAGAIARLAEQHTEHLVQAVAVATRESADFIGDELSVVELVELAGAVIEVNADFFVHRMVPAIKRTALTMQALRGSTPSSIS